MQNSVLVNGGTNQQADLITQYLNGFTNNNQNMLPLIYFPIPQLGGCKYF